MAELMTMKFDGPHSMQNHIIEMTKQCNKTLDFENKSELHLIGSIYSKLIAS